MISCDEVYHTPTYHDDLVRDPLMMTNAWTDIPGGDALAAIASALRRHC